MSASLSVSLGPLELKNPVLTASGTFGFGPEYEHVIDVNRLGGVVAKTVTPEPRMGNATPRIVELAGAMMNSIGLENKGVAKFRKVLVPEMARFTGTKMIFSVAARTLDGYVDAIRKLDDIDFIAAYELNISCPNVKEGGIEFGVVPQMTERLVRECVAVTSRPVIAKLSPNVTSIADMALAAEAGGAHILSLINTLSGMAIDWRHRKPVLGGKGGGVSGPAIKPIALKMVHQVYNATKLPIIGIGGVATVDDLLEFIVAGARAVQVGTANFVDPTCTMKILDALPARLVEAGITNINDLVGTLSLD